jgi:hypothetical protein
MKITEISANLKADRPVANNGDEIRINAGGFILVTARMLPGNTEATSNESRTNTAM